jgi:hypothetical protein
MVGIVPLIAGLGAETVKVTLPEIRQTLRQLQAHLGTQSPTLRPQNTLILALPYRLNLLLTGLSLTSRSTPTRWLSPLALASGTTTTTSTKATVGTSTTSQPRQSTPNLSGYQHGQFLPPRPYYPIAPTLVAHRNQFSVSVDQTGDQGLLGPARQHRCWQYLPFTDFPLSQPRYQQDNNPQSITHDTDPRINGALYQRNPLCSIVNVPNTTSYSGQKQSPNVPLSS